MLSNVSSSIFTNAQSIYMTPVVSAEWNHNLFTPPYITVAGNGSSISKTLTNGSVSDVSAGGKENFTTKKFTAVNGTGSVTYTVATAGGKAYKIVTYVKTNTIDTILVTATAKGSNDQYGTTHEDLDLIGWTKLVTYIGVSSSQDTISSFTYKLSTNSLDETTNDPEIYFTVPEIYETTYFDYRNSSLFPTESVFEHFRPGESYVTSGDARCTSPSSFRKVNSSVISGYSSSTYSPISPITQNPQFFLASPKVPILKTALPSSIANYKYFVSDSASKSITGIYETSLKTNKLVIKFNTIMTIPTVNIYVNGSMITVDGSTSIVPSANADGKTPGLLTLYWNGSAWTKTKWATPPSLSNSGSLSTYTNISKITVTQISKQVNSEFSTYTSEYIADDLNRMHLVELSPRLEIDLTNLTESFTIDKSLDSQNSVLPISSINSNDANITFTGIPAMNGSTVVPIFSMQSTQSTTILANILRKNVKIYLGYILSSYTNLGGSPVPSNTYIPGGVFYSDDWQENDMQNVSVQAYDVSRFLQTLQVSDYVANLKTVFDVITNLLDLSGFTDYDYDSLYSICNDKNYPMDLAYYYCNSQDTTVMEALNQIFMAYQIGAYIDEYGIMKFLSLKNILSNQNSSLDVSDYNILEGTYNSSVDAKPGKISLRYQAPKIKQSPSIQNASNADIKNSPSFVYTTSNDVVWEQQSTDSLGFNYINSDMSESDNHYNINVNDLLDIFHTFNISANGYAFIENEIVSLEYKEFIISNSDDSETVRVKNSIELTAEVSKFIKKYDAKLRTSYAAITNVSGNGTTITYTASNSFIAGDSVMISGVNPQVYNIKGVIVTATPTSFTVSSDVVGSYVSGGEATIFADYDIKVEPTGNIVGVKRGLFGTKVQPHTRISNLASKDLSEGLMTPSFATTVTTGNTSIVNNNTSDDSLPDILKIRLKAVSNNKTIVYPTTQRDIGYQTYSVKFDMDNQDLAVAGLFFNMPDVTDSIGTYFVELIRTNKTIPGTTALYNPPKYKYILVIYDSYGTVYSWSDVTGECNSIVNNFSKILKKDTTTKPNTYSYVTDNPFTLKVVRNITDGSDGENGEPGDMSQTLSVFINNVEIGGWLVPGDPYNATTNPDGSGWQPTGINKLTGMRQKPTIPNDVVEDTIFGFYGSTSPVVITGLYPPINYPALSSIYPASLREIHATKKALNERSVSYFYQDREFLNGIVQEQPLYSLSPTYIMQTTPEVAGINVYDEQYMTPAAVSVDYLPIEYKLVYYPGEDPQDKKSYQVKIVDEYSISYSTPLNTGFRAKFAVANNSPHVVLLSKEADGIESVTVNFNLWTHEIVAPSDPSILDVVIDRGNASEVVQIDSEWIQSSEAARKIMKLIEKSIDGFSRNVNIDIFGNPLVQVGDIITLSYYLKGLSQQKYLVHSVGQSFQSGLVTTLSLKRL
jgi:hypothetical protein